MHKGLHLGVAQNIGRLVLPDGHGFDTAAVDFGKVGSVIDGKGDDHRNQLILGHRYTEQIVGTVCNRQKLQHQRRATENGNNEPHYGGHDLALAHAQQGKNHAQRQGKQQCQEENGAGISKTFAHFQDHGG